MDPVSSSLVSVIARLGGAGLKKALARPVLRWRVSWRASRRARHAGVRVSVIAVFGWLGRGDVRSQLVEGGLQAADFALKNLAWRVSGASETDAARVVEFVVDEYLRALPAKDAIATGFARTSNRLNEFSEVVRAGIESIPSAINERDATLDRDLLGLHPWRTQRALEIAPRWPAVCDLAHILVASEGRGQVLSGWISSPPAQLVDAPPEAWLWLGELASDYRQKSASVGFFGGAISRGAAADYWWARAALALDQEQDEPEMRLLLGRAGAAHPLARAAQLHLDGRYGEVEAALRGWTPPEPIDRALRATLLSAAAVAQGDMDQAIEVLEHAVQADPDSTGVALTAAELLLSRARFGLSVSLLGDYARARQLAIASRDSRRRWGGDSVAATLVALKATALAGDPEGARRLLTAAPDGEATALEVLDPRLTGERSMLAAAMGDKETALALLDIVSSKHVELMVRGWIAYDDRNHVLAAEQWLGAWRHAHEDIERIQAAAALAPLGSAMPDLTELGARHPEKVAEILALHSVMSKEDRMPLLRARAHESEQLTIQLVEALSETGDLRGAAEVLREGARRWKHPLMMKMSANRLMAAGDYEGALARCADALQLAGRAWAGELETVEIMFRANEALARHDDALLAARRMVELAPQNLSARWVLVQCLVRNGDLELAWAALRHRGEPASPRTPQEVRIWIGLVTRFDTSQFFLGRALGVFEEWSGDEELQGVILTNIYGRSRLHELTPREVEALQSATTRFISEHPDNPVFRSVFGGSEDEPLKAIEDLLRQRAPDAALLELEQKVRRGELPFGLAAGVFNRSYAECAIIRIAGLVYSDTGPLASVGKIAAGQALESPVVLDSTAAVTLALLDEATAQALMGAFSFVDATVVAYRDALDAQESLAMKSTMSIRWSDEAERVVVSQIPDDVAEARSRCADRVVAVLQAVRRANWPRVQHLKELGETAAWLSALDYAVESGEAFWCDDYLLRVVAAEKGVQAFSTIDLIRHLVDIGRLTGDLGQVAESVLIAHYYVDLGFDHQTMQLAAALDAWEPAGTAASLTRPASWTDGRSALDFVLGAVRENADRDPVAVRGWVQSAAEGLIGIAGDNPSGAYGNARLLLVGAIGAIGAAGQVKALLPFVIAGVRGGLSKFPGVDDPLEEVLRGIHSRMIEQFGHQRAGALLLGMLSSASSEDRSLAARIILTTPQ